MLHLAIAKLSPSSSFSWAELALILISPTTYPLQPRTTYPLQPPPTYPLPPPTTYPLQPPRTSHEIA